MHQLKTIGIPKKQLQISRFVNFIFPALLLASLCSQEVEANELSINKRFVIAKQLITKGHLYKAEKQLTKLLFENEGLHPVRAELASLQIKMKKYAEAEIHIETLLALKELPVNVRANINRLKKRIENSKSAERKKQQADQEYSVLSGVLKLAVGKDSVPRLSSFSDQELDGNYDSTFTDFDFAIAPEFDANGFEIFPSSAEEQLYYQCELEQVEFSQCMYLEDLVYEYGAEPVSYEEEGFVDENGDFITYQELAEATAIELPFVAPNEESGFFSQNLILRHSYQSENSDLLWHNEISIKNRNFEDLDSRQVSFFSEANYRISNQWLLSADFYSENFSEMGEHLLTFTGFSPKISFVTELGKFSTQLNWLNKNFSDYSYPYLDANYRSVQFSWFKPFLDKKLLLSLTAKRGKNTVKEEDWLDKNYTVDQLGLTTLYAFSDKFTAYLALSHSDYDFAFDIKGQSHKVALSFNYQIADSWKTYLSFKHEKITQKLWQIEQSHRVIQTGVSWQF